MKATTCVCSHLIANPVKLTANTLCYVPLFDPVAVVVAFFICWCPFHAQRLMAVNTTEGIGQDQWKFYMILNQCSGILYFLSTCINPLLYNIMSHKFRDAFKVSVRQFSSC